MMEKKNDPKKKSLELNQIKKVQTPHGEGQEEGNGGKRELKKRRPLVMVSAEPATLRMVEKGATDRRQSNGEEKVRFQRKRT